MTSREQVARERQLLLEQARERQIQKYLSLGQERFNNLVKEKGIDRVLLDYPIEIVDKFLPSLSEDTTRYLNEVVVKIPETKFPIIFFGDTLESELLKFKQQFLLCVHYIRRSKVPYFSAVLESHSFVGFGSEEDLPVQKGLNTIALYNKNKKAIYYFKDRHFKKDREPYQTLIHEFGHKFHDTMIKDGYDNKKIIRLYEQAMQPTVCEITNLPKIGDPLSDLREDWWSVIRKASKEYYLEKIIGDSYVYISGKQKKVFSKEQILKLIHCPSKYSAENVLEFFAEMITLITLDLVKPSQRILANKFLEIVNQESK